MAPPEPPAPAPQDRLALPRGAFIALRKSGGFKFSAREIVVYRGGRATIQSSETPGQVLTRNLTSAQVADLRALLEQIDFAQVAAAAGRQNPDAFAYEIVARVRRKSYTVETFDGSIPESLAPLIRQMGLL